MIEREPSVKEMAALWNVCVKFIEDQRIHCEETICQCDWVIENAYNFIGAVCEEVGYLEDEDDE